MYSSGVLPAELDIGYNWMWEMANRSKRCITLDLKQEESRKIMHKMFAEADVFLANLRPSTLKRAKMDYRYAEQDQSAPRLLQYHRLWLKRAGRRLAGLR